MRPRTCCKPRSYAVGTTWKSRSGTVVEVKRYESGRIWWQSLRDDSGRSHMLTRGQFAATFPIEVV